MFDLLQGSSTPNYSTARQAIGDYGGIRILRKELEELEYRVCTLKHTDELTPEVLKRIVQRMKDSGA